MTETLANPPHPHADRPGEQRTAVQLLVLGEGRLADAIAARLLAEPQVSLSLGRLADEPAGRPGAALIVTDCWDREGLLAAADRLAAHRIPYLTVHPESGRALIGPAVIPGTPGCTRCVMERRALNDDQRAAVDLLQQQVADVPANLLAGPAVTLIAELAAAELTTLAAGAEGRTRSAILTAGLADLRTERHTFLPLPRCPGCPPLPEDSREAGALVLQAQRKLSPESLRTRDITKVEQELLDTYTDAETGVLQATVINAASIFVNAMAPTALPGIDRIEIGGGRTNDGRSARVVAIAEAVERLVTGLPRARRAAVHGSYRQLASNAVDPRTLGLYPEERYANPSFPYLRYHEDLQMPWVWGYSFARGEPVLVPETIAFYRAVPMHGMFVQEISSGCALGSSIEEAILHGLLEIVERDAFLITWYTRMTVPELDLSSGIDPVTALMLERITHQTDYRVRLFSTMLTERIPAIAAVATNTTDDPKMPKNLCAGGSGISFAPAVAAAIQEVAGMIDLAATDDTKYVGDLDRITTLAHNSDLVLTLDDHWQSNAHPDSAHRFAFLDDAPKLTLAEADAEAGWPRNMNLLDDLHEMVSRFAADGLDVIAVDQTGPEAAAGGFAAAKVIVPGTLPMVFGHASRRVQGLSRVVEMPYRLGRAPRPLEWGELHEDPHPFP
jgi:ribosomal protein S12 methylthiotransferase accessory factor